MRSGPASTDARRFVSERSDRDAGQAFPGNSRFGCSRRDLLKALPIAGLAFAEACRRAPRHYDPAKFVHAASSDVAILPASGYDADLVDLVARGLRLLNVDVRHKRVILKPNLVEFDRSRAINTHPALVAAAAEALRGQGAARVTVAEGPGHRRDTEYLLTATGLFDHLRDVGVPFVDLNHDDVRRVRLATTFMGLTDLALPVALLEADLVVSMPKLKTHHWAGMTASLKNHFGVVPGAVYGWPKNLLHFRGIENSILDLASTVRPGLAIVDAVVGMEGDGPIMGRSRTMGCVVIGEDPVSVDATCARLMGLRPSAIGYLRQAGEFLGNLSESAIRQQGEPIARFAARFDVPPAFREMQAGD
jgi:uncharacterized protein (DUF362 family)